MMQAVICHMKEQRSQAPQDGRASPAERACFTPILPRNGASTPDQFATTPDLLQEFPEQSLEQMVYPKEPTQARGNAGNGPRARSMRRALADVDPAVVNNLAAARAMRRLRLAKRSDPLESSKERTHVGDFLPPLEPLGTRVQTPPLTKGRKQIDLNKIDLN
jgi:hypothetical protein